MVIHLLWSICYPKQWVISIITSHHSPLTTIQERLRVPCQESRFWEWCERGHRPFFGCNFSGFLWCLKITYVENKLPFFFHQLLPLKAAKKLPKLKVRYVFQVDVKHFGCFCLGLYLFWMCWMCLKIEHFKHSIALPEANIAAANRPSQKETIFFQPSIFRYYVSFREGNRIFPLWEWST